jgi:hypothetical protein
MEKNEKGHGLEGKKGRPSLLSESKSFKAVLWLYRFFLITRRAAKGWSENGFKSVSPLNSNSDSTWYS